MTLGSLFDGSGGFPLAGALNGITPLWASEVEPYPIAVTRTHFPAMKHLGSVTDIHGFEIPPVDVITFGSPCQDMSVAGKRKGMQHTAKGNEDTTRSGLFYEAIRIIREMRGATNGSYPTFAVWENVPGAFSSNRGDDFRCVLEELVRVKDESLSIPRPASGKWSDAGEIVGDGFSIAWRVLDAQYWGVPQRRKRIYLVADFSGERAGKILFKRESVPWHSSQGREAREGAAADAERGVAGSCSLGRLNKENPVCYALQDKATRYQGGGSTRRDDGCGNGLGISDLGKMYTLTAADRHSIAFMAGQGAKAYGIGAVEDGSPTLKGCPSGLNQAPSMVYPAIARCLTAEADASPCLDRGQNIVALDCRNLCTNSVSGTLQAKPNGGYSLNYQNPVVYDTRGNGDHESCVTDYTSVVCAATAQTKAEIIEDTSPALLAGHEQPIVAHALTDYTAACCEEVYPNVTGSLCANSHPGGTTGQDALNDMLPVIPGKPPRRYIARRLTPTECARLQGFPDCWGIPAHKDTMTMEEAAFWETVRKTHAAINGRAYRPCKGIGALVKWYNKLHTDSAEYKMWGNGIALPCAEFVMSGIAEALAGGIQ